jgi:hypothetical protein
MKEAALQILVAEAIALDRQVKDLTEQLKERKEQLVIEAQSREDELTATEGGGRTISFKSINGEVARVTFPADELKSKIDGEGKAIEKVRALAGKFFDQLFRPALAYRPIEGFREAARLVLEKPVAKKLIDACEKDSSPRVSFETAE